MKKEIWQWSLGIAGLLCILLWILLFTAGIFVNSKEYSSRLSNAFDIRDLVAVCLFYTPTNAAMLTCLAGLAGGISSRLTYERLLNPGDSAQFKLDKIGSERLVIWTENPLASMLRSFVVYLLFVAGLAVSSPKNPFADPTPDAYLRFAALVSVVGFLVGFDPAIFGTILDNLPWARRKAEGAGSESSSSIVSDVRASGKIEDAPSA